MGDDDGGRRCGLLGVSVGHIFQSVRARTDGIGLSRPICEYVTNILARQPPGRALTDMMAGSTKVTALGGGGGAAGVASLSTERSFKPAAAPLCTVYDGKSS